MLIESFLDIVFVRYIMQKLSIMNRILTLEQCCRTHSIPVPVWRYLVQHTWKIPGIVLESFFEQRERTLRSENIMICQCFVINYFTSHKSRYFTITKSNNCVLFKHSSLKISLKRFHFDFCRFKTCVLLTTQIVAENIWSIFHLIQERSAIWKLWLISLKKSVDVLVGLCQVILDCR